MKSFFNLSEKLNEAIDQYSPQALGRKRNTMLRALTLDDSEFERWVHDRVVRFAQQNGIPLQQLDVSAFKSGFNEWQQQLQQNDRSYGDVKGQVDQYIQRFMAVAPGIISRYQSGESAPVKEPLSPTMVPYEGGDQAQQQQQPDEGEELGLPPERVNAKKPLPVSQDQLQNTRREAMGVIDLVTNVTTNKGEDEIRNNSAQFKQYIRSLAGEIAEMNQVDVNGLTFDMVNDYIMSYRDQLDGGIFPDTVDSIDPEDLDLWEVMIKKQFTDDYGLEESQSERENRAKVIARIKLEQQAIKPEHVTAIPAEHAEIGLLNALEKRLNTSIVSEKNRSKLKGHLKGTNYSQVNAYYNIQADALMEKYGTFLQGATIKHMDRAKGKLDDQWLGSRASSSKTAKTDLQIQLAEGTFIRFDEGKNAFVRCSQREILEGGMCVNKLNISMKKGEAQLMSGRSKETNATIVTALQNLSTQGFNFNDPEALMQKMLENENNPDDAIVQENVAMRAKKTIELVSSLRDLSKNFVEGVTNKGQVGMFKQGGIYRDSQDPELRKTQEIIDSAQPFTEQVEQLVGNLVQTMPEVLGEMAYIAATGEGKFQPKKKSDTGIADEVATHLLTMSNIDPASGPKIMPITRKLLYSIAKSDKMQTLLTFKSQSLDRVKKKLKPQYEKEFTDQGLQGKELEMAVRKKLDENLPYSFSTALRMIIHEASPEMDIEQPEQVKEMSRRTIGFFLREEDSKVFDEIQGVSDSTKKYAQEAFDWAFSNLDNMTQFFEMQPQSEDVVMPDISDDFGDTYFKKSIDDEANQLNLDML